MAKLNIQGMSRRNGSQQRCIVADEGKSFVFSDLSAAEPSVTAHYSHDPKYLAATLEMVGQRPYYAKDGTLMIDDIYLMVASKFPKWAAEVKAAFEATYAEGQGYEIWTVDPEFIQKKILKKIRSQAKPLVLALAYGMGAKKMVLVAQQNGFELTLTEAQAFRKLYWATFKQVDLLQKKLIVQYNSLGHIVNDFGYALYPDSEHKVLNAVIQSTVSGLMNYFNDLFFNKCPQAEFVTNIHDEVIFQVRDCEMEQVKATFEVCVKELNERLGWQVPIRFGWDVSKTFDIGK